MRSPAHPSPLRIRLLAAGALALALSAPSVPAGALTISWHGSLATIEQRIAPVRAQVEGIRRMTAQGGAYSAVASAALAADQEAVVRSVPSPSAPASLGEAERTILRAVARARTVVGRSPAARLAARLGPAGMRRVLALASFPSAAARIDVQPPSSAPALRAAAIIARAVDASMPALQRAADRRGARAETTGACSVLDQTPSLCVGGTTDDTYTQNEAVLIDLGGNDTYRNNAGGAPAAGSDVALQVDLSGNDAYEAPSSDVAVQGTGVGGGVGMLIDGTGDDTYSIVNDGFRSLSSSGIPAVTLGGTAGALGQGHGSLGGAGFLLDGSGDDTHTMTSTGVGIAAGAAGTGDGFFGGVGGFVDGGGNDAYSFTTRALPKDVILEDDLGNVLGPATQYGNSGISAQGVGLFAGTGLFVDAGGTDAITDVSTIASSPPDAPAVYTPGAAPNLPAVALDVEGLGIFGGVGLAIIGPGNTTSTVRATVESLPVHATGVAANIGAQGVGALAGLGVLSDAGGDDTYTLEVSTSASVSGSASDACPECGGELDAAAGVASLIGQGYGATGALGLLDDAGGNDTYSASAANQVDLRADDQRSGPAITTYTGLATAGLVTNQAQGYATAGGLGALWDTTGNDSYSASGSSTSSGEGVSAVAANHPAFDASNTGVLEDVQATSGSGGVAALVDLGGSDSYSSSAGSTQSLDSAETPGPLTQNAQGGIDQDQQGLALAVDLDGIGTDTYAQSPADPACTGVRGQSVWQDCGTLGLGVNA